ncbi:MAG: glycosyltransferase family 4 protein [Verrucomicrobia bacterium]|nr:glycosyltransferase family 4 protein [Verrucomicrobiota bacterium]
MKTVLIFEPQAGGHRENFIRLLANGIREHAALSGHFVFFTAVEAEGVSPGISGRLAAAGWIEKKRLLWKLFCETCETIKPDHVLILELTHLELPLALFGSPCPVSAILFVQYPELPRGPKFFSKHWKTALLLRRASVRNLFLLNGETSCGWLASRFGSLAHFIPIPDPVPEIAPEAGFLLRPHFGICAERKVFLFFGAISRRKGADALIESLHLLSPATVAGSAFVFCGEPEMDYRRPFQQACAQLRAVRPDIQLFVENHFVSDARMMALFEQSDVVLMPYKRPEYSSGVLALAAKANTPVIGTDGGLLSRLIRDNGLGLTCPVHPRELSAAITSAVAALPPVDPARRAAFVKRSDPELFAQTLLEAVLS